MLDFPAYGTGFGSPKTGPLLNAAVTPDFLSRRRELTDVFFQVCAAIAILVFGAIAGICGLTPRILRKKQSLLDPIIMKTRALSRFHIPFMVLTALPSTAFGQSEPPDAPERKLKPTAANFAYAHDSERQVFDFWKAESDKPAPVVLLIHGGGWRAGDKSGYSDKYVKSFVKAGIAVAALNYRFIPQAMEQKVEPPVKACLDDAARALQTIRSKAAEWNVDPKRVGSTGSSAGACTSLWLALHDDLADPSSSDPVARQSTRLACAAVNAAQTSLDPKELREWIPNAEYGGHAFGFYKPGSTRPDEFKQLMAQREKLLPWIKEYSPIELVSHDDPPIFMDYPNQKVPPKVGQVEQDPTHSAMYGVKLAERLKAAGVEVVLSYPGHEDKKYDSPKTFLIDKLTAH
jgi:acetyl esterase/lipase